MAYDPLRRDPKEDADFAVTVTDDSLLPHIKPGSTVYLRRRTDLRDGDVGLFFSEDGMVFRQFCRDSQGNIYLFSVNRAHRDRDLVLSPGRVKDVVCYGKLAADRPIPLPDD